MSLDDTLREELKKITDPLGLTVIEVKSYRGKKGLKIHIVIDKYNGVSISDCENVTRLFSERLDILDILQAETCSLEVSSPGIGRVFKSKEEYSLFASRQVKVILKEPLGPGEKERMYIGTLGGLEEDVVTVTTDSDTLKIPLEKIGKTKLEA